ncbi:MAG: dTDP-Rha--alpha-D-GlcNAc-pyrophosphate polyprenol alpha-3-L-rhamnosyltransferase [Flavobacteriales bacterium]|nr:dTDP-Rha--alpha-D-GlcNAc-pyrophosphate polyprenol alpha-3-L-rhamnosyltransferase [Flavobacteriales bacterium]
MKIAVVILNWNGVSWLEKFLDNTIKYSQESTIYIIDNNSTDNSIQYIKHNFPQVEVIQLDKNYGYAKGYNLGLNQITADYYILLNSDIEVTKNWIYPIIELMNSDESISACQPKILDFNNRNKFEYAGASGGMIDFLGYPFCRGRIFDDIEEDHNQYDNKREIFWASGACLFIKANHFKKINGFDSDFFAHQEEIDLCWRLKNIGYKIMVEPKSVVYHVGGGTLNHTSPYKTYLNFRNNLFMLFKNLPFQSLFIIIFLRLILDAVAAVTFLNKQQRFSHIFSVIKAHFSFYINLLTLWKKRIVIKQKIALIGKVRYSIIIQNKFFKKHRYKDL